MDTVDIQNTESPDYVDAVQLIKDAQFYGIDISEAFVAADTPEKRVKLRTWLDKQIEVARKMKFDY